MNEFLSSWSPRILSVLRFVTGFLFLWHGTQKILGFPASGGGGGEMPTIIYVGGLMELIGGVMVMLGLFTRWTSFLLSGLMAVAYFGWHASGGFLPIVNKGETAVLYCFVFLYFWFAGGGSWSVDSLISKKSD